MNEKEKLEKLAKLVKGFNEYLNEYAYDEAMTEKLSKLSDLQYQMQDVLLDDNYLNLDD